MQDYKGKQYFDRNDYMQGKCNHQEYYSQFTTKAMITYICNRIGKSRIEGSTDKYFNDIGLAWWDNLDAKLFIDKELYKLCNNATYTESARSNFMWSPSCNVSILKAAASIVRENKVLEDMENFKNSHIIHSHIKD
jgi:hypothetical protein